MRTTPSGKTVANFIKRPARSALDASLAACSATCRCRAGILRYRCLRLTRRHPRRLAPEVRGSAWLREVRSSGISVDHLLASGCGSLPRRRAAHRICARFVFVVCFGFCFTSSFRAKRGIPQPPLIVGVRLFGGCFHFSVQPASRVPLLQHAIIDGEGRAKQTAGNSSPPPRATALDAARRWRHQPTELNRRPRRG